MAAIFDIVPLARPGVTQSEDFPPAKAKASAQNVVKFETQSNGPRLGHTEG